MNDIVSVFLKLPGFELVEMVSNVPLVLKVKYVGKVQCPHCHSEIVVKKDKRERHIRHYNLPHRAMTFLVDSIKHLCRSCKRYFWTRFDGMRPWFRHTETFKWQITHQHHRKSGRVALKTWLSGILDVRVFEHAVIPAHQ